MRQPSTLLIAALPGLALVTALGAGCATRAGTQMSDTDREVTSTPTTSPTPTPRTDDATEGNPMQIQISIGDQTFGASLDSSAAARDLVAQLPATIDMTDHRGVEKTGRLSSPLSTEGQPEGADPEVGAVGYYAPGGDLVLYYGNQSYFPGIVVLGQLDGDAASQIADLDGAVTVTVTAG